MFNHLRKGESAISPRVVSEVVTGILSHHLTGANARLREAAASARGVATAQAFRLSLSKMKMKTGAGVCLEGAGDTLPSRALVDRGAFSTLKVQTQDADAGRVQVPPGVSIQWQSMRHSLRSPMNSKLAAISILFTSAALSVFGGILTGPVTNAANGLAYYLPTQDTWTASQTEAVRLGGNLVTINDAAET